MNINLHFSQFLRQNNNKTSEFLNIVHTVQVSSTEGGHKDDFICGNFFQEGSPGESHKGFSKMTFFIRYEPR